MQKKRIKRQIELPLASFFWKLYAENSKKWEKMQFEADASF